MRLRSPATSAAVAALLLAVAALAGNVAAQTAVLRGRVLDAVTRAPVPGADVVVSGEASGGRRVLTDPAGRFAVSALAPGMAVVEVTFLGYRPALVSDVVVQTSRPTYVELLLERQAIEVEGLVVSAGAFRSPDAAPTSVRLLAAEELRRTPGGLQDVSRTLLSLPGVRGGVDNRNDLLVRGGGPGENAYY
ncbi:MAG: TonB-dependent receptor, partial [Gemmatimonadetes bacterium]|nr:TonB-dependent receptor [Gemmatimonadota bacterium]